MGITSDNGDAPPKEDGPNVESPVWLENMAPLAPTQKYLMFLHDHSFCICQRFKALLGKDSGPKYTEGRYSVFKGVTIIAESSTVRTADHPPRSDRLT